MKFLKKFFSKETEQTTTSIKKTNVLTEEVDLPLPLHITADNFDFTQPINYPFSGVYIANRITFKKGTTMNQALAVFSSRYPELSKADLFYCERKRELTFRWLKAEERDSCILSETGYRLI